MTTVDEAKRVLRQEGARVSERMQTMLICLKHAAQFSAPMDITIAPKDALVVSALMVVGADVIRKEREALNSDELVNVVALVRQLCFPDHGPGSAEREQLKQQLRRILNDGMQSGQANGEGTLPPAEPRAGGHDGGGADADGEVG